jgi:hypothetical protein
MHFSFDALLFRLLMQRALTFLYRLIDLFLGNYTLLLYLLDHVIDTVPVFVLLLDLSSIYWIELDHIK